MIDLLYFAWVRERIGVDGEQLTPPESVKDVAGLLDWLADQSPAHRSALQDRSRVRFAVDQRFAGPDTSVQPGAEVAIFPPVTGG